MTKAQLLVSYPKSGNTWLRMVINSVQSQGGSPGLNRKADTASIAALENLVDLGIDIADLAEDEVFQVRAWATRELIQRRRGYRFKVHDALLPYRPGFPPPIPLDAIQSAIYLVRDPRDVACSFAVHFGVSLDEAIAAMADPNSVIARSTRWLRLQMPQLLSTWSAHVESWLDATAVQTHLMQYESMIDDPLTVFGTALQFLGIPVEPSVLEQSLKATEFAALRALEQEQGFLETSNSAGRFFRRGIAGGWRDTLGAAQVRQIESDHGKVMRRLGYL